MIYSTLKIMISWNDMIYLLSQHIFTPLLPPWPRFNIKMSSYQYRKSHCGDKTVVRSYLQNGICDTGKMSSLYWIRALFSSDHVKWTITHSCHAALTTAHLISPPNISKLFFGVANLCDLYVFHTKGNSAKHGCNWGQIFIFTSNLNNLK